MTSIYFAGPDVFRPDAIEHFNAVRVHAKNLGFECLIPLDAEIRGAPDDDPEAFSGKIFESNCKMIRSADFILANMQPFRGHEPDSGTLFEIGMAYALGKEVILYEINANQNMKDRLIANGEPVQRLAHSFVDRNGMTVENFRLPFNLMAYHAAGKTVCGTVFDAIDHLALAMKNEAAARGSLARQVLK